MIEIVNVTSILGIYYVFRKHHVYPFNLGLFSFINDLKEISESI